MDEAGSSGVGAGRIASLLGLAAEQALATDRVQFITDALPVLVSYVDRERRYRFVNATYERWIGISRAEIVGRPMREVLGELAYARIRDRVDAALAGEHVRYEDLLVYPAGARHVEARYIPDVHDGVVRGFVVLVSDITERKQLDAVAERARTRTELLYTLAGRLNEAASKVEIYEAALDALAGALDTARAAVLLFDDAGVMQFVAARGLSERYRAAVTGHTPWPADAAAPAPIFVPDVREAEGLEAYQALFAEERIGALGFFPLVVAGKLAGKFMVYYETPRVLTDEDLGMAGAIANHVAAGVARLRAARVRDRLVEELERSVHVNQLFTGMLGHDLRNPLGAMLTGTQLAMMLTTDERVTQALRRVVTSGERMTRMIDQVLDFTRSRAGGGIAVHRVATDLAVVVRQSIDELLLANPGRGAGAIELRVTGDLRGAWDPDRLAQVCSNLAGNALQHGTRGEAPLVELEGREAEVVLRVGNPGVVAPELLPILFEPFRGTVQKRDGSQGMGLGLYITQQIVQAHGGTIVVVSQGGRTTFTVVLPR